MRCDRGERHGLDIIRDVLGRTGGEPRLWPATRYGSLEELGENGWIEELRDPSERPEGAGERKRFWRITESGRRALTAEASRTAGILEVVRDRLAGEKLLDAAPRHPRGPDDHVAPC